jgi:transcriptional regulator with XRE-family HTH domain
MKKGQTGETEFLIGMGNRIRQLRKAQGVTQAKLAMLLNCEKSSLSRMEAGQTNTTILTLKKIAGALEVPLSQLFLQGD